MDKILTKKDIRESLITLSPSALFEGKLPSNGDIAACPSIYKMIQPQFLKSYLENGFQRILTDDGRKCYGEGIYASLFIDGEHGATRLVRDYGSTLIEGKVLGGFQKYVFIDTYDNSAEEILRKYKQKYYGSADISVSEQYFKIISETERDTQKAWEVSNWLAGRGNRVNRLGYSYSYNASEHTDTPEVKALRKYGVRGLMYDWGGNSLVVLPLDFSSVIIFGYTEDVRQGASFDEVKRDMKYVLKDEKYRESYEKHQIDWAFQLSGFYDNYDKHAAATVKTSGELYCVVEKNGKYNIVQVDTDFSSISKRPKEISEVWFDAKPTAPSIRDGIFQFKINGVTLYGTVYYPPEMAAAVWYPENPAEFNKPNINKSNGWWAMEYGELEGITADYRERYGSSYGIALESLAKTFRRYLKEEIEQNNVEDFLRDNQVHLYSATDEANIQSIFKYGQLRQFAFKRDLGKKSGGDAWYGIGVYTKLDYKTTKKDDTHVNTGRYGRCIIDYVVNGGFSRFLIFNEEVARRTYGEKWRLSDQCRHLVGPDEDGTYGRAAQLYKDIMDISLGDDLMHGQSTAALGEMYKYDGAGRARDPQTGERRTEDGPIAARWTKTFREYNIRGAVYFGRSDGLCAVCWHYDDLIPYAYTLDDGHTWHNELFDFDAAKKRASIYVDPQGRYGHLFAKVSDKVITCKVNGEEIYCTTVKVDENRYNVIYAQTGKKIFPVDFNTEPNISLNGIISFVYKGVPFMGTICHPLEHMPAFWFPMHKEARLRPNPKTSDDWYPFEEIDNVIDYLRNSETEQTGADYE